MTEPTPNPAAAPGEPQLDVLIIGAGFGGLGMGRALLRDGVRDFLILEKGHDVGGAWRENTYPGAACDVPSQLYSFSFAPNPEWTRKFAPQAEILQYLRDCARRFGLQPHLRFGAEVAAADWDEATALWTLTLADGSRLRARTLISAVGQLSRPQWPRLAGLERFGGHQFHSAEWDHGHDLRGKTVAVIGTGASALQFIPEIAPQAERLLVFQRSACYVLPRDDHPVPAWQRALYRRWPLLMKLPRLAIYAQHEARAIGFTRFKRLLDWMGGGAARQLLARQVPDPALRRALTPDYAIGCKRVLLSNDYFPAFMRRNVTLVTRGIAEVTAQGLRTDDGVEHHVDTLIFGTGFKATEFLTPMRVRGRGGVELNQAWRDGVGAYLGITVPGFPNFHMLYGPNTNLGHNSIVYMLESQIAHVAACLRRQRDQGARTLEVRDEVYRGYDARIQRALEHTVWASGCSSWYLDAQGRNPTAWPGFTLSYRWLTRHAPMRHYRLA